MTEIEIYTSISKLAKRVVLDRHINVDSEEIVHEAYLRSHRDAGNFEFESIRKHLNYIIIEQQNNYSDNDEKAINNIQSKFCKSCNEDLPISAFGITVRKKTNKKIIQTYCHGCLKKKAELKRRESGILPRNTFDYPEYCVTEKQKTAYYSSQWQKRNADYINTYQSIRHHTLPHVKAMKKLYDKERYSLKKQDGALLSNAKAIVGV